MSVTAGRISINLTADSRELTEEMKRASAQVEASVASIRNSLDSLKVQFTNLGTAAARVSQQIETVSASAKKTSEAQPALNSLESGIRKTVEAATALAASKLALDTFFLGATKGAFTTTQALGTVADGLTNVYRAARLALSPTLFTAGSLALGYAVEQVGKATFAAGNTLQNQGTIAGLNRVPISTDQVSALSQAGGANNLQSLLGLYNSSGGKNLRDIAEQLNAIKDPADKARTAVSLFGSDASTALKLLNENFVENSDRVQDWSLTYSGETKTRIEQFRNDIESLKAPFTGLSDVVRDSMAKIKVSLVSGFAGVYDYLRNHAISDALAPFNLDRYADAIPGARGAGTGFASGVGGLFSTASAAVSGGFLSQFATIQGPSLFGTADAQFQNELQRNFRNDKNRTNFLSSAASAFPQSVIPDSATSLAGINSGTGIDALRDQLEGLRSRRSQIISQYFTRDADGKLQFKDDTTAVQQASSVASLQTTDRNIQQLQARIEALRTTTRTSTPTDFFGDQIKTLNAQISGSQGEVRAAGTTPLLEAVSKGAAQAGEEIARLNQEYARLKQSAIDRAGNPTELAAANALPSQLNQGQTLAISSLNVQLALNREITQEKQRAAALSLTQGKQDQERQTANLLEQIKALDELSKREQERNKTIGDTINKLETETRITSYQIDAVGKGRQAERDAILAGVRGQATQDGIDQGLNPTQIQNLVNARVAQKQSGFALQDAVNGIGQSAGAGFNQFFKDFEDNTKSAGVQVREVLGGAFGSLDNQLTRLIAGQKASFADFFRGIAAQIASLALNNAFASIFKSLNLGGTSSGSSGGSSGGSTGGSLLGGIFKALIGGFRAEGGDVSGGTPYVVGERGPELFVPGGRGSIVPNGAGGSQNVTYNIDARESSNSADMELRVSRAIRQARQEGAANGARLSREARRRVPNSKAFAT